MKKVTFIKKIVSVVLTTVFVLLPTFAIAASLTYVSDTLSTLKVSTASDHTIQFTTPTGIQDNSETITIQSQTGFDLATETVAFGDIDIATSTVDCDSTPTFTDVVVAAAAGAGEWGAAVSSQVLTLTAPTDADTGFGATAGTCIQIQIGDNATGGASNNQIVNPGSAADYTIAYAGTFTDTGTSTVNILDDDQVQITADVPQSMSFSISETALAFGNLSTSATRYATSTGNQSAESVGHSLSAGTNATGGYTITVSGNTLESGVDSITVIGASNTALDTGTAEQFGFKAVVSGSGSGAVDGTYTGGGYGYDGDVGASIVATAGGATASNAYAITYAANIAPETEAGAYSTALTFVATANF